jgi:hemoglobin
MQNVLPNDVYDIIGEEGIARLTAAFYQQVRDDDILAPMYPEDELLVSEDRLREFLIFRLGGPRSYVQQRGHPRLRMRHASFPIDQRARDRWVALMDHALDQAAFPADVTTALRTFFHEVATFLINRDSPLYP